MSLQSSQLDIQFNVSEANTVGLVSQPYAYFYRFLPSPLTDGTAADNAQKFVTISAALTTTGTTYDLTAITGGAGNANVNFTAIKAIVIEDTSTTAANYVIAGAAATSAWEAWTSVTGSTFLVPAGGAANGGVVVMYNPSAAGWTVDGTHKNFKLATAAGTATAKVLIIGEGS